MGVTSSPSAAAAAAETQRKKVLVERHHKATAGSNLYVCSMKDNRYLGLWKSKHVSLEGIMYIQNENAKRQKRNPSTADQANNLLTQRE